MASASDFLENLSFLSTRDNLFGSCRTVASAFDAVPLMLVGQMVLEPLFICNDRDVSPHRYLLLWLTVVYLLHSSEIVIWMNNREETRTIEECESWSRHFFNFALVIGMMWGFGTLFFFPHELLMQVFLVCAMLGLAAVSTTMNAMHPPAFFAYLLGLMLPLTFRVLVEQDETHIALGSMLLLFLVVMLGSGHFLNKFIVLSLRQRFENESLALQLASMNDVLEHKVEERTAQLQRKTEEVSQIRDVTIMAMASLAETRDNETGNHLKRTQHYIRALAMKLRNHPQFRDFLTEDNIESLYKLAPLHDIGKVGIPDAILLKRGKLTPDEFEIMKTHPLLGGNALAMAESGLPTPNRFLHIAREIANGHHEKWNGSGYPLGLQGEAIPISARLMALADVYDALISRRVYKEPFTHQAAVAYILHENGTHFDPAVTEAFQAIQEEFRQIAEQYQD